MKFRPCIDIHNGKVKQIVGSSLKDQNDVACENFVSEQRATFYAELYKKTDMKGGHIILLNQRDSEFYEATKTAAVEALTAYPGGFQIGGGINVENAKFFLQAGASQVIVTSYVFYNGRVDYERLKQLSEHIGKEKLVIDLSCKKVENEYVVVTDRWQKLTEEKVNYALMDKLAEYCCEFLIHAVDVEGKAEGIEKDLVKLLGNWGRLPITYAGGVHNYEDLHLLKELGNNKLDVTIGSALDIFGGSMQLEQVLKWVEM